MVFCVMDEVKCRAGLVFCVKDEVQCRVRVGLLCDG